MNYKGDYSDDFTYEVGDVVVYEDNVAYWLQKPAPSATPCHDTLYWGRLVDELQDTVMMFHNILTEVTNAVAIIPRNISDDAITLKDESDNEYLITVDASGETPELAVTLIEEEESEEEGSDET